MKKRGFANLFTLSMALLSLSGCATCCSEADKTLLTDALTVAQLLSRIGDSPILLLVGDYAGGTAILDEGGAAFWVQDHLVVYMVNEAAREAAPELEQAPDNVTWGDEFKAAAHRKSGVNFSADGKPEMAWID